MTGRGRPKSYNARRLEKAAGDYFYSITRLVTVTEKVDTGRKDEDGHTVYELRPVKNRKGEEVTVEEFIIPPSVAGLCAHLGIHRSTWDNYRNSEDREIRAVTERIWERLKAWNEAELITRPGKDLKGIIFNLENNYGYSEKQEMNLGGGAVEEYLRSLRGDGEA